MRDFEREITLKVRDRTRRALSRINREQTSIERTQERIGRSAERINRTQSRTAGIVDRQRRAVERLRGAMADAQRRAAGLGQSLRAPFAVAAATVGSALAAAFVPAINQANRLREIVADTRLAGFEDNEEGRSGLVRLTRLIEALNPRFQGGTEEAAQIVNEVLKRVDEAVNDPDGERARFFQDVGLDPQALDILPEIEQFNAILRALREAFAAGNFNLDTADNVLGGSEQEALQPVIAAPAERFDELVRRLEERNFRVSDAAVANAERLSEATRQLDAAFTDMRTQVAQAVTPALTGLAEAAASIASRVAELLDVRADIEPLNENEQRNSLIRRVETIEERFAPPNALARLLQRIGAVDVSGQRAAEIAALRREIDEKIVDPVVFDRLNRLLDQAADRDEEQPQQRGFVPNVDPEQTALLTALQSRNRALLDAKAEEERGNRQLAQSSLATAQAMQDVVNQLRNIRFQIPATPLPGSPPAGSTGGEPLIPGGGPQ